MSVTTLGQTGSSNALYILNSNGNVGIGKSNPSYALDVLGEINASSNIRIGGQSLQGLGAPNQVVLTSGSSTWTVPSGVTQVQVELVGGGGSGGNGNTTTPVGGGGGGGAGGYFRLVLNSTLASSLSYSVGAAGNNTTVTYNGFTYTATAGGAGGNNAVSNTYPGVGGSGGVPSYSANTACLSALVVNGGDGSSGGNLVSGTSSVYGGTGGASYFGSGSKGGPAGAAAANATAYGSGGGGGGNSTGTGGTGAPGVVIITYFTQTGLPTNYTATAPLSMTGTTLAIAAATSNALGVVQVDGTTITASNGIISKTASAYGWYKSTSTPSSNDPDTSTIWVAQRQSGMTMNTATNKKNQLSFTNTGIYKIDVEYTIASQGGTAQIILRLTQKSSNGTKIEGTDISYDYATNANTALTAIFNITDTTNYILIEQFTNAGSVNGGTGNCTVIQIT